MKRLVAGLLFLACLQSGFSQTYFTSTSGGAWNLGTTWDVTPCASGCVAGVDYPGPNDVAIIAVSPGGSVSFPKSGSPAFSCKDLYIVNDVAGSLRATGLSGNPTLTIHGQISGAVNDLSGTSSTTVDVFQSSMSTVTIIFTGSNLDDPNSGSVITDWGHASPFYRVSFNPGSGNTIRTDSYTIRNSATVQSGTVQLNSGHEVRDAIGTGQLIVDPAATLRVRGTINGDGTTSSRFPSLTANGTITTEGSSFVNFITFTLGSSATLNIGFNGANQTQGWWYQSSLPTTLSISPSSTVNYNASATQNIYPTTYGNLSLTSLSVVTKSLTGGGLAIQGNLDVGTNVNFAPSSQVDFTGSGTQLISGGGILDFAGGLEVNKSAGTLTLSKNVSVNGITITAGSLDLGNFTTTVNSGNVINAGTISSGTSGTLQVAGTSSFSGSGSLSLNHLVVTGAASITSNALTISGNLTNNGTLSISTTSTVTFSGGVTQTISGNAFSLGNMVVNKTSSTLLNNSNLELLRVLTLTTGTFDADGAGSGVFTLNSDTNGDASIGPMSGGSIVGEVTFERYFNNTIKRWRNIGFPVSSVSFSELGSSFTLVNGSLATYTESVLGNVDQGWNTVSGGTLNSRLGHSAYMYNTAPITISVRGPLLQNVPTTSGSPYDYQVTYTDDPAQPTTEDGWNFVPNPYASPIDWNASSGWTKTRVNAAAAMWDAQNGVYVYSNVGWDGVIAQGQAFWVQTNAALPRLTSTESVKVTDSDPTFYRMKGEEVLENKLLITLTDGQSSDKALIQYKDKAGLEFDPQYDATKLNNLIFNLSSLSPGGLNLAANVLPKSFCTNSIKLNLTNIKPGKYSLRFDGVLSFSDVEVITLIDHLSNASRIVQEGESISFSVDSNPSSFGSERFELRFSFIDGSLTAPEITVKNKKLTSNYKDGNQWYHNGVAIPGATNSSITASRIGTYQLEVNANGCIMFASPVEILRGAPRSFPNPANHKLTVDLAELTDVGGHIYIVALSGDVVLRETFDPLEKSKQVIVSGIRPGMYLLKILSSDEEVLLEERIVIRK